MSVGIFHANDIKSTRVKMLRKMCIAKIFQNFLWEKRCQRYIYKWYVYLLGKSTKRDGNTNRGQII